jgi:SAM-dependent methyltransferase
VVGAGSSLVGTENDCHCVIIITHNVEKRLYIQLVFKLIMSSLTPEDPACGMEEELDSGWTNRLRIFGILLSVWWHHRDDPKAMRQAGYAAIAEGFERTPFATPPAIAKQIVEGLLRLPIDTSGTWLDVACGTGVLTRAIAASWRGTVIGLDASDAMLLQASGQSQEGVGVIQYIQGDASRLPIICNEPLAGISIIGALGHMPTDILEQVHQLLQNEGVLVIGLVRRQRGGGRRRIRGTGVSMVDRVIDRIGGPKWRFSSGIDLEGQLRRTSFDPRWFSITHGQRGASRLGFYVCIKK